jgi:hypothetical protein
MTEETKIIPLTQICAEVKEWSSRNFPNNKPHHPLLGMVEEKEELNSAFKEHDVPGMTDAIADWIIYACDYAWRNDLSIFDAEPMRSGSALGLLCHYHLKGEQGIRYTPEQIAMGKQNCLNAVVAHVKFQALSLEINFAAAVSDTWKSVKARDWAKNPMNAAAKASQAG